MNTLSTFDFYPNVALSEPKQTKNFWLPLLQASAGAVFGGSAMLFIVANMRDMQWWQGLIIFTFFIVSIWLQLIIHELGHALGGRIMGMKLIALSIGRLRFEQSGNGLRMRWGSKIAGIGGFAFLLPPPGKAFSRLSQAVYLLGGPLANLIAALLGFLTIAMMGMTGLNKALVTVFSAMGLMLGLINLIPFYSGGFRTDGGGLIDLWRRPNLVACYFKLQQLLARSMGGERPRDWPTDMLPDLDLAADDMRTAVASMQLVWALDSKDNDAADHGARALWHSYHDVKTSPLQKSYIALNLAAFAACIKNDGALLSAWRVLCKGSMLDISANLACLEAEAARLRGDNSSLQALINEARSKLPRVHDAGSRIAMAERLDVLQKL
jgi:hypothetical protein